MPDDTAVRISPEQEKKVLCYSMYRRLLADYTCWEDTFPSLSSLDAAPIGALRDFAAKQIVIDMSAMRDTALDTGQHPWVPFAKSTPSSREFLESELKKLDTARMAYFMKNVTSALYPAEEKTSFTPSGGRDLAGEKTVELELTLAVLASKVRK